MVPKCIWCDCPEEEHAEYRECLLLDGELLCEICCNYDIINRKPDGRLEILDVIKKVTGKDVDEQTVKRTCLKCSGSGE